MTPASIRNRNPGAQYPGPSARKFGGTSYETLRSRDGVHKIATFPTHQHGVAAQFDLLDRKYCGMTIEAAITKWCGGFYANTYLKVLEQHAGVTPQTVLTKDMVRNPDFAIPFARAMARQEAGRDYPLDEDGWRQGHAMAFGGGTTAPGWSPDNDVPTPKPETRTAEAVKTVATWTAPVAAGTAAVTEVARQGVPAVPEAASKALENANAWRGLVQGVTTIGTELAGLPWRFIAFAGVAAGGAIAFRAWRKRDAGNSARG